MERSLYRYGANAMDGAALVATVTGEVAISRLGTASGPFRYSRNRLLRLWYVESRPPGTRS